MRKLFLMSLLFIAAFAACTKEKDAAVSTCIQDRLNTFDQLEACDNASVSRYTFMGENVYTFDRGVCADMDSIEVRSEDCALLGYLGGYLNNTMINNSSFYAQAQFESLVWAN